ncbi:MAG: manganese efflux pump MntP family protein [Betaproteobacteria bacterium]
MFTTTLATAVGLAMDAVAVSIASGLSVRRLKWTDALKMALFFGVFQAVMPVGGYFVGGLFATALNAYAHWITFFLLTALGIKMIVDANGAGEETVKSPFATSKLLVLAIATSLDAFAVGISFSLLDISLVTAATIIGVVTFVLCLPAVWFGARLGKSMAKRAEVFGGIVLILIGSKILIEHLMGGL